MQQMEVAWDEWCERVGQVRGERAEAERKEEGVETFMKRASGVVLDSVFVAWCQSCCARHRVYSMRHVIALVRATCNTSTRASSQSRVLINI